MKVQTGVDNLKARIKNRTVEFPSRSMTAEELRSWLEGYEACQNDVLEVINVLYGTKEE
jgi:hypothetical protein